MYKNIISILAITFPSIGIAACNQADSNPAQAASKSSQAESRKEIQVKIDAKGYHPPEAEAPANAPVRLVFTRTIDEGCGQQLVFPTLNIRRDLPLNESVAVDVTMPASGKLVFTCGMDMYRGSIVVKETSAIKSPS